MQTNHTEHIFKKLDDVDLIAALNELSRTINIISTYGKNHPAVQQAANTAEHAMQVLFTKRRRVVIGNFNGTLTIDEGPVTATGTLLKSLERRLTRLRITGLRISKGISLKELVKLAELLSSKEAKTYSAGIQKSNLTHINSEDISFHAVRENQSVADNSEIVGMGGNGVLVLEDEEVSVEEAESQAPPTVHVEQIVAFLKGDIDIEDENMGEEMVKAISDPARLGQMIMESVSIRQSTSGLAGESLGDIVLGCLRRTYDGLRTQASFQNKEGTANLQKALLLLEESMLEKMRQLTGEANPELDRKIVQAIQEMDEGLSFELAARQYIEHRDAIEQNKQELQSFLKNRGTQTAEALLQNTDFPTTDWRRIVLESGQAANPPIAAGLNSLAKVFEKLEKLMKSQDSTGTRLRDLLGEATNNLDGTIDSTREKLDMLSQQLQEFDTGTIGGEGRTMNRKELLSSISEVAQELMQPLTAINASLEMMLQGYAGTVTADQQELLGLAANSGEHLKFLMNELINIVGLPTNKGVDNRFHTTSDQVVLLQSEPLLPE
jgi:hypothetical protein